MATDWFPVLYTRALTPPAWEVILERLDATTWGDFIAQVRDAIKDHTPTDHVAVRIDPLIRPDRADARDRVTPLVV